MVILRKAVGVLLAFAIAMFAGLANAQPQKLYSLKMSPQTMPSGPNVISATFTNVSPGSGANSSFNAVRASVPSTLPLYTISVADAVEVKRGVVGGGPPVVVSGASVIPSASAIRVENLSPAIGKNEYVIVSFSVTAPESCAVGRWNPDLDDDVWTGAQVGSGQPFTLVVAQSEPNTTTTYGANTIAFSAAPTSIAVGVPFNVSVTQTRGCTLVGFPAVSLTSTPTAGFSAGEPSFTPDPIISTTTTKITTFTGNVYNGNPPSATLVLTATAGALSAVTSPAIVVYADGEIQCTQALPNSRTNFGSPFDPMEPGQAKSVRQLWNSDGSSCKEVPYDFTNVLFDEEKAILRWPTGPLDPQRAAVFKTSATGKLRDLPAGGAYPGTSSVPLSRFKVAWEFELNGDPKNKTDALMCLDQEPPRPYAKLLTSPGVAGSSFTAEWDSANPPVEPGTGIAEEDWKPIPGTGDFEFTLGVERIRAKKTAEAIDGDVRTVTLQVVARNVGGTPSYTGTPVNLLSVVMPIYTASTPAEYTGKPVRMCVIEHGVRMYVPSAGITGSLPQPQYFQFVEYYDGDGWIGTEDQ